MVPKPLVEDDPVELFKPSNPAHVFEPEPSVDLTERIGVIFRVAHKRGDLLFDQVCMLDIALIQLHMLLDALFRYSFELGDLERFDDE